MKKFKCFISVLLVLLVCAGTFSACQNIGSDGEKENSGKEIVLSSKGLKFTLLDNKNGYEVSRGSCTEKNVTVSPLHNGLPVLGIAKEGFKNCSTLADISLPDCITFIGEDAFYNCENLVYNEYDNARYLGNENNPYLILMEAKDRDISECEIHPKTKIIGQNAFHACTKIKEIIIPDGVLYIDKTAFCVCEALEKLVIPNSVLFINEYALSGLKSLKSITLPNKIPTLEYQLLEGSGITRLDIPDSVTYIDHEAFYGCKDLAEIVFPEHFEYIGISAFSNCPSLKEVVIPNGVTSLENHAFSYCTSLESITVPKGVNLIDNAALEGCTALTDIYYGGTVEEFKEAVQKGAKREKNALESIGVSGIVHCSNGEIEY